MGWPQTVHMGEATNSTCTKVATNSTREVRWPPTVHVPAVLHAVASCALSGDPDNGDTNTPYKDWGTPPGLTQIGVH